MNIFPGAMHSRLTEDLGVDTAAMDRLVAMPVFCSLLEGSPIEAFETRAAAGRFAGIKLKDEAAACGTWTGIFRVGSGGKSAWWEKTQWGLLQFILSGHRVFEKRPRVENIVARSCDRGSNT
jgi:hypothetical protein